MKREQLLYLLGSEGMISVRKAVIIFLLALLFVMPANAEVLYGDLPLAYANEEETNDITSTTTGSLSFTTSVAANRRPTKTCTKPWKARQIKKIPNPKQVRIWNHLAEKPGFEPGLP